MRFEKRKILTDEDRQAAIKYLATKGQDSEITSDAFIKGIFLGIFLLHDELVEIQDWLSRLPQD